MGMVFVDRESAYPNRYLMTTESGTTQYVILERADEPVTPGTPLNAETFSEMMNEIKTEVKPVIYGGTGAENAADARENLGLGATGVTAGTYGGWNGSGYYSIPNITVDELGRVTNVSTSSLVLASTKSNGLMTTGMYSHIVNGKHLDYISKYDAAIYKDGYIQLVGTGTAFAISGTDGTCYLPKIYGVYVYCYINESRTVKVWVPVKDYWMTASQLGGSGDYTLSVGVKFPEDFYDFNVADAKTTYAVMYEKAYVETTTTTM